jgi:hypothetical protein
MVLEEPLDCNLQKVITTTHKIVQKVLENKILGLLSNFSMTILLLLLVIRLVKKGRKNIKKGNYLESLLILLY